MNKRLVRRHEAIRRLAVGKTKFHQDIVAREGAGTTIPGTHVSRLKLVHIGPRASACFEDELDRLIEALRAALCWSRWTTALLLNSTRKRSQLDYRRGHGLQ
jgi:hypothetical protein